MIKYPSILGSTGQTFREFDAYVFDKLDGRYVRAEWQRKKGWSKFGTRERRFDETDREFGPAIPLFHKVLAEPLQKVIERERWLQPITVSMEYWNEHTLAGLFLPDNFEPMRLSVIDVAVDEIGLLLPKDYVKLFCTDEISHAAFLGRHKWTRGFVSQVWDGQIPGVTCEGVIGKYGEGEDRIMAKAKTHVWIEKVRAHYAPAEADKIIAS